MRDQNPYTNIADEELCTLAASDDRIAEETLVMRYSYLVRACARPYFLMGGDSEDLVQEGMFGLLKAVREYNPKKGTAFHTFAEVCVRNRLVSAVKAAALDKHTPLNHYVSIETPLFDENADFLSIGAADQKNDPEELVIGKEELRERMAALRDQLSGFEAKVLGLYLSGLSYQEIGDTLGRSLKSVDNAVQRVRRKLARRK